MNNIDRIKIVCEWVKENGNVPIPPMLLNDYSGVKGQKDNSFAPKSKLQTINTKSVPTGLSMTIPPEVLNYTEQDMEDEINKMEKGKVNTFHSEDYENMQEWEESAEPSIK
jgi:hypothetical protein|tara:strand:- start:142 stop:474 length:333 start_codon:yes stop_codon:yes gene_type:complete